MKRTLDEIHGTAFIGLAHGASETSVEMKVGISVIVAMFMKHLAPGKSQ